MHNLQRIFLHILFIAGFLFITPVLLNQVHADYSCNNQSVGNITASGTVIIQHCNTLSITVTNGTLVISGSSQVSGNITTTNATLDLQSNTVAGNVSVSVGSGDNIIKNNTIAGNVTVNGGTLRVTGNTISGDLSAPCPTQILEAGSNNVSGTTNLCPQPWYKISNSSFYKYSDLYNQIPTTVDKFLSSDGDDTGERLFDVNDAGVVAAAGPNINFGEGVGQNFTSTHGWKIVNYPKLTHFTTSDFLLYKKSRSSYATITSVNDIVKNKINVISGNVIINDNGIAAKSPFVLIVDGDATINIGQQFNPSKGSLAIMATGATTFNINSTVEEINGIFIGKNVNFVSNIATTTNPLKINGNIVVANNTGGIIDTTYRRDRVDKSRPSIFSALYIQYYIDLLPLLSTRIYEQTELSP